MTPVDATSTASAAQPSGAAVSAAIVSAFARPCGAGAGVGAAAVDDDGARHAVGPFEVLPRHEDRRRLREIRREERSRRRERVGGDHGEVERVGDALMPQCSALDVKPRGAVTPPAAAAIGDVAHGCGVSHAAPPAERTRAGCGSTLRTTAYWPQCRKCTQEWQSVTIFSEQPDVRNDRKPEVHEEAGRVGERAQLVEAGHHRASRQLVDDLMPEPEAVALRG